MSRYWVGGSGNWDASNTANWSATDGGAGGAAVPTTTDDVFFTVNSNATLYTVTITAAASAQNLTFAQPASGAVTLAGSSGLGVYGSLLLVTGMGFTYSGTLSFRAPGGATMNLDTQSVTLTCPIQVITFGTWNFNSTIVSTKNITITFGVGGSGIFNTNDFNITCVTFGSASNNARTLNLGSSTINCTGVNMQNTGSLMVLNAGTSIFKMDTSVIGAGTYNFLSGGFTYNQVYFTGTGGGTLSFTGTNIFAEIKDDNSLAHSLKFVAGTTQIVTLFTVAGSAGKLTSIISATGGSAATLLKVAGKTTCDYLSVQDISATGGARWYAGAHSTNVSGNSGWIFGGASNRLSSGGDPFSM